MNRLTGASRILACMLFAAFVPPGGAFAAKPAQDPPLMRLMVRHLEERPESGPPGPAQPLACIARYPLTATTAYLLLGEDPTTLKALYSRVQLSVSDLLSPDKTTAAGLLAGTAAETTGPGNVVSPALNALAAIELWSMHLIAWRTGAFEDALEYLSWSKQLSAAIARDLYSEDRERFLPAGPTGRPLPMDTPGGLLPLLIDETLGAAVRARIIGSFAAGIESARAAGQPPFASEGLWADPLCRPVVLDLLSNIPEDGVGLAAAIAAAPSPDSAGTHPSQEPWIDFWRRNPSRREGLFPIWAPYSSLVNLTLLLERESLAQTGEIRALRSGIDSLGAIIALGSLSADDFAAATRTANALMARVSRFADLVSTPKERWRVANEGKWIRLSPRTKRLVMEGCAASLAGLGRTKAALASRFERDAGVAFRLSLPRTPVGPGEPLDFEASLASSRGAFAVSHAYLHIGEQRWPVVGPADSVAVKPGAPLRFARQLALAPGTEPGIVPLPACLEFIVAGRRLELRRYESVVLAPEHEVFIVFPEGRQLRGEPLPVEIALRFRPDHDIQGTVEGAFAREFATDPPLPARFIMSASSDLTNLSLTIDPKGWFSPGRYPFSITVSLDDRPIALFEETLFRPFRWLHLGPIASSDEALRSGPRYQSDLFRGYAVAGGIERRWREAPADAFDAEGALLPGRLFGAGAGRCVLLQTAVKAPQRLKLEWSIATKNTVSLWMNGAPVLLGGESDAGRLRGSVELRSGPNSILIAACWSGEPDRIQFDLLDENGLPPAGLGNELETIIDGYERLAVPAAEAEETKKPGERLLQVSFILDHRTAKSVSVIGSFNNWDPAATPMRRDGTGLWRASLVLKPGRYPYKFVIDRKTKIVDPANRITEPDGFGGRSSVLEVK